MFLTTVILLATAILAAFAALLIRSRRELTALKERFPRELLDVDSEVVRLKAMKATLEQELVQARECAARDVTAEHARVTRVRDELEQDIQKRRKEWELKFGEAMNELQRLHAEVEGLSEEAEIQSFGLYKPRYNFASVEGYKEKLELLRAQQKAVLKNKAAAICTTSWHVQGSVAEGRRMTERQLKLMLRAFNGECDAAIANATWKNIVALQDRIRKSFEGINSLGETVQCRITAEFLRLRLDELEVAHEYAERMQAQKEEQRQLREQMREEEKANREIERERDEAEREEERYNRALERARAEIGDVSDAHRSELLDKKLAKLEAMLAQAQARKQRAISQAELTRLGHVYILSNEGTFGPNVFKIGMTRRLDPMDRVDELGGASVPFRFDVHALIKSEDAPGLEQKLHEALEPHRVNMVNRRKEYFRVPLEKIVDLVTSHHGNIQFTQAGEAAEFRKTLAIRAEREAMVAGKAAQASAVTRAEQMKARYEELKRMTA